MKKVIRLREKSQNETPANIEVIHALRHRLDQAERGRIAGIVAATIDHEGTIKMCLCGTAADSPALAAVIATRLKAKIDVLVLAC